MDHAGQEKDRRDLEAFRKGQMQQLPDRTPDNQAEHLGDGAYAYWDGMHIWLRTLRDDGVHEVALEFATFQALTGYASRVAGWRTK